MNYKKATLYILLTLVVLIGLNPSHSAILFLTKYTQLILTIVLWTTVVYWNKTIKNRDE